MQTNLRIGVILSTTTRGQQRWSQLIPSSLARFIAIAVGQWKHTPSWVETPSEFFHLFQDIPFRWHTFSYATHTFYLGLLINLLLLFCQFFIHHCADACLINHEKDPLYAQQQDKFTMVTELDDETRNPGCVIFVHPTKQRLSVSPQKYITT